VNVRQRVGGAYGGPRECCIDLGVSEHDAERNGAAAGPVQGHQWRTSTSPTCLQKAQ
jgi:hypothetical protein